MGSASAAIDIAAPVDVVWGVMLDTAAYGEWNPFIVRVDLPDGDVPTLGERVVLHVQWGSGGGAKATERITALEPGCLLEYAYGGPLAALGLVRGRRRQELAALDGGGTRYVTHERLHGLLAWAAPLAKVQDGFERHAGALKARAEELA